MKTFAFVLTFLLLALRAQAQEQLWNTVYDEKAKTSVTATLLIGKLPATGYAPVRLEFVNGQKKELSWTLKCSSTDSRWRSSSTLTADFRFSCPPESSVTHDVMVPIITAFQVSAYGDDLRLGLELISDQYSDKSSSYTSTQINKDWPTIGMCSSLFLANSAKLNNEANKVLSSSRSSLEFAGDFSPATMPEDVRGLLGYEMLIFTADDFRKLTSGSNVALRQWLRGGGKLIIYQATDSDSLKSIGLKTDTDLADFSIVGQGTVYTQIEENFSDLNAEETVKFIKKISGESSISSLTTDYSAGWDLQKEFGSLKFNPVLIIIVLIIFAIIVGPINLFVFAKAGQRHKLFLTTPVISLVASLLLVILIIFQDGFGGSGIRAQLIEVGGSGEPYAAVTQEQICRTGILLSTSFDLDDATYITPGLLPVTDWSRANDANRAEGSRYTFNLKESSVSHDGNYFQSRSELAHILKMSKPSRERLSLTSNSTPPKITSSFGYPLESVYYTDNNGEIWTTQNIQPGQVVTLTSAKKNQATTGANQSFIKSFSALRQKRIRRSMMRQNNFIAFTKAAPGIDSLSNIKWNETRTIITGPLTSQ